MSDPIREAIRAGHKVWYSVVQVSRLGAERAIDALVAHEQDLAHEDARRTIARELWMTDEEIAARYSATWSGPESMEWRETGELDEDGNPVTERVPLDEARAVGYRLTIAPRRRPLPGSVYTVAVPLPEGVSLEALGDALRALDRDHRGWPKALRLHPAAYVDYRNLRVGGPLWSNGPSGPDQAAHFCGIPVQMQPRAPQDTLIAVYPLEG